MGGTAEFTISQCTVYLKSFARLAEHWLDSGSYLSGDLDNDGDVDFADLDDFADEWLNTCPYGWTLK